MSLAQGQVIVLIPGLQGPRRARERPSAKVLDALLEGVQLPSLTRLLRRGAAIDGPAGQHLEEMFFQLIGLERCEHGGWPMAALSRHAEHGDAGDGYWLRADPVHLRADMSKLRLFDGNTLQLELDEARQLSKHLNEGARDELGFRVEPDTATRWFVHLERLPRMRGVSPAVAHGEDAASHMPSGPDAARWHKTMNLVQMLLHSAPVNERRERAGRPAVNSLWFWGAGALPARQPLLRNVQVLADRSWARGAGRLLGGSGRPLEPPGTGFEPGPQPMLVLLEDLARPGRDADPVDWRDQLHRLDDGWLTPLLRAVDRGRIQTLQVHVGHGIGLALRHRSRWRRWSLSGRGRQPLPRLMVQRLHGGQATGGDCDP